MGTVNVKSASQVEQERIESLKNQARSKRDKLLKECDYVIMPDYPVSDDEKVEWEEYRQALRDITDQSGFPEDIEWPDKPANK